MNSVERHNQLIPMGTQVSSKGRFRFCEGHGPEWIMCGDNAYVYDDKGRQFLDTTGGLGGLVLGHDCTDYHSPGLFPLPHVAELELAGYLHENVKNCEMMRFLKTGTDATAAAIRLARVHTNRSYIIDFGSYHGWADAFLTPEHAGVPDQVRNYTWRLGKDGITSIDERIAAVILEPWPLQGMDLDFLNAIRERCDHKGVVLIYDEVISGFRCGMSGVMDHGAPAPDLTCAGKAMGNGWPISVVYGKREVMECWSRTHISGTHFADPACMQGALEVLEQTKGVMMFQDDPPVLPEPFLTVGTKMWWCVKGPDLQLTALQKRLMDKGWLTNFSHFTYQCFQEYERHYRDLLVVEATAIAGLSDEQVRAELGSIPLNRSVFRRNA